MSLRGLQGIYQRYRDNYYSSLSRDSTIPEEDRKGIKNLLSKPWNPYIRRHSALTQKSAILKEHTLRQHAGWSARSQMHLKYLHYYGNESSNSLLQEYGILPKDNEETDVLRPKQCPNCNEPNRPDQKFCVKCRLALTYEAWNEKQDEITLLRKQIEIIQKDHEQVRTLLQSDTFRKALLQESK
jgi:hypothetical protein